MKLYESILSKKESIAVVGLGYVGMPIAVEFAKKVNVIGFDVNKNKIQLYKSGIDPTCEVGDEEIKKTSMLFTDNEEDLKKAKFIIVAVPTPINQDKTPDLTPIESSSTIVGRNLSKGSIVVYESTVYPGVTEDICVPILEKESGLKCGVDFKVGYSPERINPSDKKHRLINIVKVVSGMDSESLEEVTKVYEMIIQAGVYPVSSIKVAEATKVVENSQRDINIAFMNEMAMAFDKMGIDTNEVVDAMDTKWNALGFRPGLVGGHCIGVDPYYFVYKAENLGYHSQIVASGRRVNDSMGKYVADQIIKKMIKKGLMVKAAKVLILGVTFKENCGDIRNSKVVDIIERLQEFDVNPIVADALADKNEVKREYNIELSDYDSISGQKYDVIVFAVSHDEYKNKELTEWKDELTENGIIIDVKNMFSEKELKEENIDYWKL